MEEHHHRFLVSSLLAVVIGGALAAGGYWSYWNFYARFRPVTVAKNQAEIQRLLEEADWVSPGRSGPVLYLVAYRDCDACTSYEREEFAKLAAANIDTRVIVFARPDNQGLAQSTPAERSSVAELWINRDWNLFSRWMATPHAEWTAEGVKPSDHDMARRAVVGASRDFVTQLWPLVKTSGLGDAYPLLIWRDRDGFMRACSCTDRRSFHFVLSDLSAAPKAPAGSDATVNLPPPTGSAPAPAAASAPSSAPASGPAMAPDAPATSAPASASSTPSPSTAISSAPATRPSSAKVGEPKAIFY